MIFFTNKSESENFLILFEFVLTPHCFDTHSAAVLQHIQLIAMRNTKTGCIVRVKVSERSTSNKMPSFQTKTEWHRIYTFNFANYPSVILTSVVNLLSPNEICQETNPLFSFYIYCIISINPVKSVLIYDALSERLNPLSHSPRNKL